MSFDKQEFRSALLLGAEAMGLILEEQVVEGFLSFAVYVVKGNTRLNLTRITDEREMAVKHFLDSLAVTLVPRFCEGIRFVDIGTGAGFPGIPLKMYDPEKECTLLDSVGKKVAFLQEAIEYLGLSGIEGVNMRAEELAITKREYFDGVVCRGVGSVGEVAELSMPLLRVGGIMVIMKGPEKEQVDRALLLEELGGACSPKDQVEYELPFGLGKRRLIVIEKVKQTKQKYPRRAGMARKRPLF
ncbi:MAG: 16S rRNA (guanine(527)-N(7))-methyltransferase RsmG [Limnochordia bacterium]|nr:16S rRNA (guanine(527)-N(7))-methyltransferase RsmG [Limnochordia bacterium]